MELEDKYEADGYALMDYVEGTCGEIYQLFPNLQDAIVFAESVVNSDHNEVEKCCIAPFDFSDIKCSPSLQVRKSVIEITT